MSAAARPFGVRSEKDRKNQITVSGAREERRCECTRGIVCFGSSEAPYACGRASGAWDHRFCFACRYDGCGQGEVPR